MKRRDIKKPGFHAGLEALCSCMVAAEQKARTTYDNLLRLIDNPDVRDPLKFLREREIVHFQRFGEALRVVQENLDAKNYYAFNPAIDIRPPDTNRFPRRPDLQSVAADAAPSKN